jgi:superfamily II DNA/RNA helicase
VDIVVACPGRLADHLRAGDVKLDAVEITVLDEADHMADLGFLPTVRQLLDRIPRDGQQLLFSATLDNQVDVLVRRYLTDPATHSLDSSKSPVAEMSHHLLRVRSEDRLPVLVDLTAAPGRTLVFTRTKRGAKTLTRRLVAAGVPAVELHGDLAQNARRRNLLAFADLTATTLVATDIAARGIHVDDIALVIHADPPTEYKAYLHRSGRTARGGASGTVITLMTDDQVRDVHELSRKAGISPQQSRARPNDPLLAQLAPGPRTFLKPAEVPETQIASQPAAPRPGRGSRARKPARSSSSRSSSSAATRTATPRQSTGAAGFSARSRPVRRLGGR